MTTLSYPKARQIDLKEPLQHVGHNGRIGLVSLATDVNSETDLRRMLPEGVELFTNRIMNANPVTMENLRAMQGDMATVAGGILPESELPLDVMIYGCTSGTMAIGEDSINTLITEGRTSTKPTNPITAVKEALKALNVQKLSILTPYTTDINDEMARYFVDSGMNILNINGFCLDIDDNMAAITPASILEGGLQTCLPEADALFISCTSLRSSLIIEALEQKLQKPVISSNQALVWHSLQLIGYDLSISNQAVTGFGQLFKHNLA